MADGDNDSGGGLMGNGGAAVGGLMNLKDPDLLVNLGLGIMSAGRYGGNLGDGISRAIGNWQQQKKSGLDLQMQKMQLGAFQQSYPMWMQMMRARTGAQGGAPPSADQSTAGTPNGLMSASPQASAPSAGPAAPGMPTPVGMPAAAQSAPPAGLMGPRAAGASQAAPAPSAGGGGFDDMLLGALGGSMGMPGAQGWSEYGKAQLQYDPAVAQRMEAAKSALSIDLYNRDRALQQGDRQTALMWHQKALTDSKLLNISDRNGNITAFTGGAGANGLPNFTGFNPDTGIQSSNTGGAAPITGFPEARGAIAGAEARGKATGETIQQWDPVDKVFKNVPKSTVTGGGGGYPAPRTPAPQPARNAAPSAAPSNAAPAPGGAPAPTGSIAAPGPQTKSFAEGRGTQAADYLTESQKNAEAARDTNYSLDMMLAAGKNAQLGPGALARAWVEKQLSGIGQQFGVEPSGELANYTELEKYANKVAFAATKLLGSREAAQIVQLQIQSNPNKSMVPDAFNGVALSMKAMNNYILDKNVAMQQAGEDAQSAAAKWTQQVDPRVWAMTLSPKLSGQLAESVGKSKIQQAYQYMQPEERQALISNFPADLRAKWLGK